MDNFKNIQIHSLERRIIELTEKTRNGGYDSTKTMAALVKRLKQIREQ